MRRLVALAAAVAAALLVIAAPPSSAGGPTSVLAVNYAGSRAAGALTGSTAYANLEKALDVYNTPAGDPMPPATFMDSQVRLTWLIHDVTPWRVDAILVDGDDVWVETSTNLADGKDLFQTPAVLHRPKDAALLLSALTELGVLGDTKPAITPTSPAPLAGPAAATREVGSGTQGVPEATLPGGVPWWATTVAAVLALALGVVLGRRVRSDSGAPEPGAETVTGPPVTSH